MQTVTTTRIPSCDICSVPNDATVDAKTTTGPWASMCEWHFLTDGFYYPLLGTGMGQRYVLKE